MSTYTGDDADNTFYGELEHRNTATLGGGNDSATGGDLSDSFFGGDGNDTLSGANGSDSLYGGGGNDYLRGGDGADFLLTGYGEAYLDGGAGDDRLVFLEGAIAAGGTGDDELTLDVGLGGERGTQVFGGAGDDTLVILAGAHGAFDGGTGEDTVYYGAFTHSAGVIVNLLTGSGGGAALGDTYNLIEDASGTDYADTLIGNGWTNALYGGIGDDQIVGAGGADYLDGGMGIDTLDYAHSPGAVQVDLVARTAYGADAQQDIFRNFENVSGSAFNDRLTGDGGDNVLRGNNGKDTLIGGDGADTIAGGAGDDRLVGGLGADALVGQAGADTFVFASTAESGPGNARDRINDFSHAQGDRIDVSGIDANTAAAKNQAFTFIGTQAFHGTSGELHYAVSGDHAVISGDVNGDKVADFQIVVNYAAAHPFVASDFVL